MTKTAAIVIIGNEILSGKVADENGPFLSKELRFLGVDVRRLVVIPDEEAVIAEETSVSSGRHDWVFTTGGVGPTHDDVTIRGVAMGFRRRVIRDPMLEAYLRNRYGSSVNDAVLKMAEVPEGAELVRDNGLQFPVVAVSNLFIFPGIPSVVRKKFGAIRERFRESPFHIKRVYLSVGEEEIARALHQLLESFPRLLLGSYPATEALEYRVVLTLESKDPDYLDSACRELSRLLPGEKVQKIN